MKRANNTLSGIEKCHAARARVPKKPKKMDKIFLGFCIYWITFVILCFITFWTTGQEPVTLISCGLGGGTVEAILMAYIEVKRDREKKEDDKNE